MNNNEKLKAFIAFIAFVASIVIGFISLFIPPEGVIDSSVLIWTSQMLIFVATLIGINLNFDFLKDSMTQQKDRKTKLSKES